MSDPLGRVVVDHRVEGAIERLGVVLGVPCEFEPSVFNDVCAVVW